MDRDPGEVPKSMISRLSLLTRQSKRIIMVFCVLSIGAGVAVMLQRTLVQLQRTRVPRRALGPGGHRFAGGGSGSGSVRFLVSLTAPSGTLDFTKSNTSAIIGALAQSVVRSMGVVETDVTSFTIQPTTTIMDVGLEMQIAADSDSADCARRLRSQVDSGKLSDDLALQGFSLTVKLRSIPQPFSVAGLPEMLQAADQADPELLSALFAPILILLSALLYGVLEHQLIERCVRTHFTHHSISPCALNASNSSFPHSFPLLCSKYGASSDSGSNKTTCSYIAASTCHLQPT